MHRPKHCDVNILSYRQASTETESKEGRNRAVHVIRRAIGAHQRLSPLPYGQFTTNSRLCAHWQAVQTAWGQQTLSLFIAGYFGSSVQLEAFFLHFNFKARKKYDIYIEKSCSAETIFSCIFSQNLFIWKELRLRVRNGASDCFKLDLELAKYKVR